MDTFCYHIILICAITVSGKLQYSQSVSCDSAQSVNHCTASLLSKKSCKYMSVGNVLHRPETGS